MRLVHSAVVTCVCGFALAACGGGGTPPTPGPTATAMATPTAAPLRASYLYAGDPSGKTTVEYGLTGTAPIATLSATGAPNAFAVDALGNIYVAFAGATIEEHAAGTHRLLRTITGFHHVNAIALDGKDTLYVVDGYGYTSSTVPPLPSKVSKVAPGATLPSAVLLSVPFGASNDTLISLAVDQSGNVYAGGNAGGLYIFAPGAVAPTRTLSQAPASVAAMAADSLGNLYVYGTVPVFQGQTFIEKFAPGGSAPAQTLVVNGVPHSPQSLALDASDNLYELNDAVEYNVAPPSFTTPSVFEYAAESTAPMRTIVPLDAPVALAVDTVDNLYVIDADATGTGEYINEYAPGVITPTRTVESSGSAIGLSSVP